jgi:hypothetical protein
MKYCFSFFAPYLLISSLHPGLVTHPVIEWMEEIGFKRTGAEPPCWESTIGSESVLIDPFLRFSQGVRVGFISSPENGIELILM